jgi:hypothetical protein
LPDRTTPGTFRELDGSPVPFPEALVAWQAAARTALLVTAGSYRAVISSRQLAEEVQAETGIYTRMMMPNWIGQVLGAVSAECRDRGEPMLSALCVGSDGSVGPGYETAVVDYYGSEPPRDPDLHAANERLKCHQFFEAELPADGGHPAFTAQEVIRRRRASKKSATEAVRSYCPSCHVMLPISGLCGLCA